MTIASPRCSSRPTSKPAQRFYEDKVGLKLSPETIPNHLLFEAGDGTTC